MKKGTSMPDLSLREKILSNDYLDLIVPIQSLENEFADRYSMYAAQLLGAGYGAVHIPNTYTSENIFDTIGYSNIPRLFTTLDSIDLENSGILRVQIQSFPGNKGEGVLLGFLDTGIDYTHPAFLTSDGRSRIFRIWDQTIQTGEAPANMNYGSEYTTEDINAALASDTPFSVVPSIDEIGHGTFLAGVAAGSSLPREDFTGAAPECDIAMVKLKPAKQNLRDLFLVNTSVPVFQETDIMLAIRYLIQTASAAGKPVVICLGLGTNQGDHTKYSPLGDVLSYNSRLTGVYFTSAAGNEAGKAHHYYGNLENASDQDQVQVQVAAGETGFCMELWAFPPDLYSIGITSPLGENITALPPLRGQTTRINFILEKTVIEVTYKTVELSSGSQLIFLRIADPTPGIWTFQILPRQFFNGSFHMWLPITGFINEETFFLNPNPDTTLTCPANADGIITVSTYNSRNDSLYINSSRGYTRAGAIKPDLAAPGVDVFGSLSASSESGRLLFARRTGSSIASAITAGAVALLVNWGLSTTPSRYYTNREVKSLLIRGADRSSTLLYPNREWGYGTLNLFEVFRSLM